MDGEEPMDQEQAAKPKKKKKKVRKSTVLLVFIVLLGAAIMAYPTFSDWWNSFHQTRAIASYVEAVENADEEQLNAMIQAAREYNQRLLTKSDRYKLSEEERIEYESLLNLSDNGVIGYIQIPAIRVNLPFYHGTDEAVLQVAIGHLEGTSLPVGGESTHAVLSGHRGLPSARLFTSLDKMQKGDVFTITVLNQTLTYEVDQIHVVLPQEMEDLDIFPGQDYCTLLTCTPYGINTHRLLVRGHWIPNLAASPDVLEDAVRIPVYIVLPAVGIPLMFLFLMGMLLYYRRRPVVKKGTAKAAASAGGCTLPEAGGRRTSEHAGTTGTRRRSSRGTSRQGRTGTRPRYSGQRSGKRDRDRKK